MEMKGEQLIRCDQMKTWSSITDPEVLKLCIPGCESMDKVTDTEYQVVMAAKVGPVSARFKGRINMLDIDAPNAYTLTFEGQGGVAGFAKGQASVLLLPEDGSTRLQYTAKAAIGGKLAQVGSRLIDGVAKMIADNFFKAFNRQVSGAKGEE
jgi:carbon monoxide dehydrogenase subunit G